MERGGRERHERAVPPSEQVPGVVGGVVRAAPSGDHEAGRPALSECRGDGGHGGPALPDQPRRQLRLLPDLIPKGAQRVNVSCRASTAARRYGLVRMSPEVLTGS